MHLTLKSFLYRAQLATPVACVVSLIVLQANSLWALAEVKQTGLKMYQAWSELNPAAPSENRLTFNREFPDRQWWESFNDPQLTVYIQAAIQNNPSIQIALQQLAASRALTRQAFARELPGVNLNPSAYHVGLPRSLTQQFPIKKDQFIYNLPLQLSYELDWFGKNWDAAQSAKKQTLAVDLQSKAALNAVLAEVSSAYINLLRTDALLQSQQQQVVLLKEIARLEASRQQAGLGDQQTLLEADRNALDATNELKRLAAQQALFSHQLAVLTGSSPASAQELNRNSLTQMELPMETPAGMPTELLTRRPDIRAQEALLESARIDVKVARKAFLPSLNLGATVGTAALKFSKLWDWANVFNLQSLVLNQPIFKGGQLRAELNYRKAKQREALERYRQTVLTSLKEVEDSLSTLKMDHAQLEASQQQVTLTQQKLSLDQSLESQGLLSKLDLLRSQSEFARYQQATLSYKADAAIATIDLYKALGGGF